MELEKETIQEVATNETSGKIETGCVKWFNNKRGYGFITYKDGDKEIDIFVHHSGIQPLTSQYKTLTLGEYVNFVVNVGNESGERDQAVKVTGINGGALLCDQYSKRKSYLNYDNDEEGENDEKWQSVKSKGGRGKGGKGQRKD